MSRLTLIVALSALFVGGSAFAGDRDWNRDHPRRHEVNKRLNNQNRRVDEGVATGKLSPAQARQIHAEDHAIRQQERAEAAANGGHITKAEQRQLNREENGVSQQIHEEKHP